MNDIGHNATGAQIKSIIERVERLEAEIKELNLDKSEVYSEAKSNGLCPKTLKKIVAIRRVDLSERKEQEEILELYMSAIGMEL